MSAQKATQPISHERKLALLRTASASRKLTVWYRDHKRLLLRLVFITCNRAHKSSPTNWTIMRFRLRFCSGESVFAPLTIFGTEDARFGSRVCELLRLLLLKGEV